jgi:hypothetical protein
MAITDSAGYAVTGANAQSLAALETALHELRCFIRDPVATVNGALEESPQLVMGHVLKGYLHLLGTEPAGIPVARQASQDAAALPASDRERRHVEAVRQLTAGRWHDAGRTLEDLSVEYPRDALALQAGHQIDFFTGDARMLRDRIARALPAWSGTIPGFHAVLGMHAFGLEEMGDYAGAEAQGRRGVGLEPRDGWAQHAVAHVMEMQGRQRDGIAWMRARPDAWAHESFFAAHNWWHVALYHLDLGEVDEVLALYDGPIYGKRLGLVVELVDASALLWRLALRGIDVGERWNASRTPGAGGHRRHTPSTTCDDGVCRRRHAGRPGGARGAGRRNEGEGDNAAFTREVGHQATQAIMAFGDGNYAEAVRLLRPIRGIAHRFGGSHAQRDLLDLTLIEATIRAGDAALAAALAAERVAVRPTSPFARLLATRAAALARRPLRPPTPRCR